jgi:GAF domain-containing protein
VAASTDATLTDRIARIAAEAGSSPDTQALDTGAVVHVPDLRTEPRFGCYARLMVAGTPVRSVLSFRLSLRAETLGILTLYAATAGAFDEQAIERAELLADHAAIAVDASVTLDRAHHLEHALTNSRTIGLALGVLVERYKITPADAFQQLRVASQTTNRKLADIAAELVETGEFTPPES